MSADRDWLQPIEYLGDEATAKERFSRIAERCLQEMRTETLNFFALFLLSVLDATQQHRTGSTVDNHARELEGIEGEQDAMLRRMVGDDL